MRLTNNKTYCEQQCDYGKEGECFFDSVEESFDCFERKIYDKLKEYEDLGTVEELKELKSQKEELLKAIEHIEILPTYEYLGVLHIPRTATIKAIKRSIGIEV